MKRILVLCDFGEHRSVLMASLLRERGHFAVSGRFENWCKLEALDNLISEWDVVIQLQEGGKHFVGRDMPEVTDYEWHQRFYPVLDKLGL